MARKIIAVILGVVVANAVIMLLDMIGHQVYPVPADLDPTDLEAFGIYVESLPTGAFLFVLAGWGLGALFGGTLAAIVARVQPMLFVAIIGGLVLAGTIWTLFQIPHPMWFSITGILVVIVMTAAAGRLAPLLTSREQ